MIAVIIESLIVAASAEYLERWSYEHGVVDIHPWSPAPVQAAWQIVLQHIGDELEVAITAWSDMLSSMVQLEAVVASQADMFSRRAARGAPS